MLSFLVIVVERFVLFCASLRIICVDIFAKVVLFGRTGFKASFYRVRVATRARTFSRLSFERGAAPGLVFLSE